MEENGDALYWIQTFEVSSENPLPEDGPQSSFVGADTLRCWNIDYTIIIDIPYALSLNLNACYVKILLEGNNNLIVIMITPIIRL